MTSVANTPHHSRLHATLHPVRWARFSVALLTSTALTVTPLMAAENLPTGGQVVSGSVSIGTSGSAMTVTQGSNKAIVNWNGFSVGAGNSVNFVQPNSSSAILNRVTGNTTSTIAGSITGNGQVYLINPNGIAITPTGTVKVGGGFVASTLGMDDEDFLKGQYELNGNGASGSVSNEGIITVGRGGYAALIGGTVRNDGLIAVPMGKVGLGSGEQATLDLSGDGFLQVAVPTVNGAEGNGALIENSGTISAEGGTVVMKAATARHAARNAINLSGVVAADSVSGSDGDITLGGGEGGAVTVSGKVKATSATGKGGKITATGKSLALMGATINASGAKGGGTVKIGGDYQGKGTTQRAETTSVDASSIIRADATQSGNGGTVIVWSDQLTTFDGLITARGAGASGLGGNAEVSGKAVLGYNGFTDLSGAGGFGSLLLDPYDITISNSTASNSSGTTATGNNSIIAVSTLQNALSAANVTVTTGAAGSPGSQSGNILVYSSVEWTSGRTLTLSAYGSIDVLGNLTGGTGAKIALQADNSGTGIGTVNFGQGAQVTASGGVSIYYNPTGNVSSTINSTSYKTPTNYSGFAGSGTSITAYMLVNTVQDLQNSRNNLSGTYALGRDIDASNTASWDSGRGFNPIGDDPSPFAGTFDGLSHTITGLTVNRPTATGVGLFGFASGTSIIRNVGLIGGSIRGADATGGLAGYIAGQVSNSYSTANVSGSEQVAGLVGANDGSITNSYATGSVTGTGDSTGGLVGTNFGTITNSYATGNVSGTRYVGGLVGNNESSGTISGTYASGAVSGTSNVAGLVGLNNSGSVSSSFWDIGTTGKTYGVGASTVAGVTGLTTQQARAKSNYSGWNFNTVWYQTGDMRPILRSEAATAVGGVVTVSNLHQLALIGANLNGSYVLSADIDASATKGTNAADIWSTSGWVPLGADASTYFGGTFDGKGHTITSLTINRSTTSNVGLFGYNNGVSKIRNVGLVGGSVKAKNNVGGLVGVNYGSISNAYSTGSVSGDSSVGGLVGMNNTGTITNAYTTGAVSGVFIVGGLVGDSYGNITNAYATGAVTGTDQYVGGLVGYFDTSSITNSYATGAVTGGSNVGGFAGYASSDGAITSSYWNKETTGQAIGIGVGNPTMNGFEGLTTAQFQNTASFAERATGWDFDTVWAPSSNGYYPELYSLSAVVRVKDKTTTSVYGSSTGTVQVSLAGGPSSYIKASAADSFVTTGTVSVSPTLNVGITQGELLPSDGTITSANGKEYRVVYYGTQTKEVTKASLTVTATATKTYDGQAYSGASDLTYNGFVNNENATVLGGALVIGGDAQSAVDAGQYAMTASGLTSSNYAITFVDGTLTIDPKALTVTVKDATKTYDGQAYSGGNGVTYDGFISGQNQSALNGSVSYGGTAQNAINGGEYTITASGLTASNYDITFVDGKLTVDKKGLTVTAKDATKTYNGVAYTGGNGVTYEGFVNGENQNVLSGDLSYGGNAQQAVNAGEYTISASGLSAGNYDIQYVDGKLNVAKKAVTVTADDANKIYGNFFNLKDYTAIGLIEGDMLSGLMDSDGVATSAVVGSYAITQGTLSSSNYDISFVNGQLTVDRRALTVTAKDASKTYGDVATLTQYTAPGLVNNDTLSGSLASMGAAATAGVNDYAITQGTLANGNYDITFVDGTLTVDRKALTVTAKDASKTYGDLASLMDYTTVGLVNDDTLLGSLTSAGAAKTASVDNYVITQGTLDNGNYDITFVEGTLIVGRKALTVTAKDATKVYDGLAYSGGNGVNYSGFVNGENESVLGGIIAYDGIAQGAINEGKYELSASGLTSGNYAIGYAPGTLTVAAKPVVIPSKPSAAIAVDGSRSFSPTQMTTVQTVAPQRVAYSGADVGSSTTDGGAMTTEHPQLSGATCALGPNFTVACAAN